MFSLRYLANPVGYARRPVLGDSLSRSTKIAAIDKDTAAGYAWNHQVEMTWSLQAFQLLSQGLEYSFLSLSFKPPTVGDRNVGIGQALVEVVVRIEVVGLGMILLVNVVGTVAVVRVDSQTRRLGRNSPWQEVRSAMLNSGAAVEMPRPAANEKPLARIVRLLGSTALTFNSNTASDIESNEVQSNSHLAECFGGIFQPDLTYTQMQAKIRDGQSPLDCLTSDYKALDAFVITLVGSHTPSRNPSPADEHP